jgi:hypothetical protein
MSPDGGWIWKDLMKVGRTLNQVGRSWSSTHWSHFIQMPGQMGEEQGK